MNSLLWVRRRDTLRLVPSRGKKDATFAEAWLVDEDQEQGGASADDVAFDEPDAEVGTETQQWLAVPPPSGSRSRAPRKLAAPKKKRKAAPSVNGAPSAESARGKAPQQRVQDELAAALQRRDLEFAQALERREQEFAAALEERDAELKEREAAIKEQLEKRLRKRKAELEKRFERREAELQARIEELEADIAKSKGRTSTKPARRQRPSTTRKRTASSGKAQPRPSASSREVGKLDLNEATFEELRALGLSVTQSARLIAYRDVRSGYESLDELEEIPGLPKETLRELRSHLKLAA